ncbi:MAG: hypothetical protein KGL39_31500 [Patescibacteria group bacterium]|nr:hypothetical protein [Patescibacteria group bacterium]
MNKLLIFPLIVAMLSISPAFTQNNIDSTPVVPIIKIQDSTGEHTYILAGKTKLSFAERHPVLHRAGRKIRRTCQILLHIVSFAGSAAQVARLFY